jgi:hypothetical protein
MAPFHSRSSPRGDWPDQRVIWDEVVERWRSNSFLYFFKKLGLEELSVLALVFLELEFVLEFFVEGQQVFLLRPQRLVLTGYDIADMVLESTLELCFARTLARLLLFITQTGEKVLMIVDTGWLSVSEHLYISLLPPFCLRSLCF